MPSNPKGYRPKTSRTQLPLTVGEQRKLFEGVKEKDRIRERALLAFFLSTGAHPMVLANVKCGFTWSQDYYEWHRPKTHKVITSSWSRAMRESGILQYFDVNRKRGTLLEKDVSTYRKLLERIGQRVGIKLNCLKCRHTSFVNEARLQHNAFDIAMKANTNLQTVYRYYMIGMGESKALSPDDKEFLQWLMEP